MDDLPARKPKTVKRNFVRGQNKETARPGHRERTTYYRDNIALRGHNTDASTGAAPLDIFLDQFFFAGSRMSEATSNDSAH
jgi:hypothetical protein